MILPDNHKNAKSVCCVPSAADAFVLSLTKTWKSAGRDTVGGSGNRSALGGNVRRRGIEDAEQFIPTEWSGCWSRS